MVHGEDGNRKIRTGAVQCGCNNSGIPFVYDHFGN